MVFKIKARQGKNRVVSLLKLLPVLQQTLPLLEMSTKICLAVVFLVTVRTNPRKHGLNHKTLIPF